MMRLFYRRLNTIQLLTPANTEPAGAPAAVQEDDRFPCSKAIFPEGLRWDAEGALRIDDHPAEHPLTTFDELRHGRRLLSTGASTGETS
jgi:hypothetical protein